MTYGTQMWDSYLGLGRGNGSDIIDVTVEGGDEIIAPWSDDVHKIFHDEILEVA